MRAIGHGLLWSWVCVRARARAHICVCIPVKCWLLAGELGIEVSLFRDILLEAGTLQEVSVLSVALESQPLTVMAAPWPL